VITAGSFLFFRVRFSPGVVTWLRDHSVVLTVIQVLSITLVLALVYVLVVAEVKPGAFGIVLSDRATWVVTQCLAGAILGAMVAFFWAHFSSLAKGETPPTMDIAYHVWIGISVILIVVIGIFGADTKRLLASISNVGFQRSEIVGFLAGLGTTFAAVPDLVTMLRRRSTAGMNPRMAAIMGIFQILWIYYGLLIASGPVIAWNVIAVLMNFLTVGAYAYLLRKEKPEHGSR